MNLSFHRPSFPTPKRIREMIQFAEKQRYLAGKDMNATHYFYWDRKVRVGEFLLTTYPLFIASLISLPFLLLIVWLK